MAKKKEQVIPPNPPMPEQVAADQNRVASNTVTVPIGSTQMLVQVNVGLDTVDKKKRDDQVGYVCSVLSIIFGFVAFLFCPPVFGLAGFVLGIVGIVQSESKGYAILGIVLSVVGTVIGMLLGIATAPNGM